MKQRTLALQQAYKEGAALLEKAGVPGAAQDAWLLLSYVTGLSRAFYYGHPQKMLLPEEAERYFACIEKRSARIPLQHITGEQEFMGYSFLVNEHVLIPRQDTELLAEEARRRLSPGDSLLDVCTGSGCLAVSLMKLVPGIRGTACDISAEALSVARENARRQQVDVEFRQGDLFSPIEGRFDVIVSNPPYIPTGEIEGLMEEVRRFEPMLALDGSEDGLYFYRRLSAEAPDFLRDGGWLLVEIGCDQGRAVAELFEEAGFCEVNCKKDLAGLDRVVTGRRPPER